MDKAGAGEMGEAEDLANEREQLNDCVVNAIKEREELKGLREKCEVLMKDKGSLTAQVSSLEDRQKELLTRATKDNEVIRALNGKNEALKRDRDELSTQVASLKTKSGCLEDENQSLKKGQVTLMFQNVQDNAKREIPKIALNLEGNKLPIGLENLGKTCFMSAILQCMSRTTSLIPRLDVYGTGKTFEITVTADPPAVNVLGTISQESNGDTTSSMFEPSSITVDDNGESTHTVSSNAKIGTGGSSISSSDMDRIFGVASATPSKSSPSNEVVPESYKADIEKALKKGLRLKLTIPRDSMTFRMRHGIEKMRSTDARGGQVFTPSSIHNAIKDTYSVGKQHDSHELLKTVVDMMKKDQIKAFRLAVMEYYSIKNTEGKTCDLKIVELLKQWDKKLYHKTFVDEVFGGELVTFLKCLTCGSVRRSHEAFLDISLPICGGSLQDCLKSFTEPEQLTGSNAVECKNCHRANLAKLEAGANFEDVFPGVKPPVTTEIKKEILEPEPATETEMDALNPTLMDEETPQTYDNATDDLDDLDEPAVDSIIGNTSGMEVEGNIVLPVMSLDEDIEIATTTKFLIPNKDNTSLLLAATQNEGFCKSESAEEKTSASISASSSRKLICEAENGTLEPIPITKCPYSRHQMVSRIPECLTIHLKRFEVTSHGASKLCDRVTFPYILDFTPFCHQEYEDLQTLDSKDVYDEDKEVKYALYGIVEHRAESLSCGHYISYVNFKGSGPDPSEEGKNREKNASISNSKKQATPEKWFYISDSSVQLSNLDAVLGSDPYILFYERVRGKDKPSALPQIHLPINESAPACEAEIKPVDPDMNLNSGDEEEGPAIGIDLGTTHCCVAVYYKEKVIIIPNQQQGGILTTPSYVSFNLDGTETFGDPAKRDAYKNAELTIYDAKRIIGRKITDPELQNDMKWWPFEVKEDEGVPKIMCNHKALHPEQISGKLLVHLKERVESFLKLKPGAIKKAVITVPAYFNDGQRQATVDAGKLAKLDVLTILNEPTAAAIAYSLERLDLEPKKILIYDLGGGTFDVAVLDMKPKHIEVLGVKGDTHLGGEDFDKKVMEYCVAEFKMEHKIDLFAGKDSELKQTRDEARRRLRRLQTECECAKKTLASAKTVLVTVEAIIDGKDLNVTVTRKTFDELNLVYFQRTMQLVEEALKDVKLQKEEIDDVVLVGGSSKIPKVQKMLETFFGGKALNKSVYPDLAVVKGAAVQAAWMNEKQAKGKIAFKVIQDVTPMSLGVEIATKELFVMFAKNTAVPSQRKEVYGTVNDNQTEIRMDFYEGEDLKRAANNKKLGTFSLKGIPRRRAGAEPIDIWMEINSMGILHVEAVCRSTQGKNSIIVHENKQRMSKETINKILVEEAAAAGGGSGVKRPMPTTITKPGGAQLIDVLEMLMEDRLSQLEKLGKKVNGFQGTRFNSSYKELQTQITDMKSEISKLDVTGRAEIAKKKSDALQQIEKLEIELQKGYEFEITKTKNYLSTISEVNKSSRRQTAKRFGSQQTENMSFGATATNSAESTKASSSDSQMPSTDVESATKDKPQQISPWILPLSCIVFILVLCVVTLSAIILNKC